MIESKSKLQSVCSVVKEKIAFTPFDRRKFLKNCGFSNSLVKGHLWKRLCFLV
ncbi:hypothetical protein CHCC20375_4162 [Bacillus licheniformis]|nr:hypothetical protein CHCC20375_4162 [Bacillus licheniformis]